MPFPSLDGLERSELHSHPHICLSSAPQTRPVRKHSDQILSSHKDSPEATAFPSVKWKRRVSRREWQLSSLRATGLLAGKAYPPTAQEQHPCHPAQRKCAPAVQNVAQPLRSLCLSPPWERKLALVHFLPIASPRQVIFAMNRASNSFMTKTGSD